MPVIFTVADFKFWGICLVNMSVRMVRCAQPSFRPENLPRGAAESLSLKFCFCDTFVSLNNSKGAARVFAAGLLCGFPGGDLRLGSGKVVGGGFPVDNEGKGEGGGEAVGGVGTGEGPGKSMHMRLSKRPFSKSTR